MSGAPAAPDAALRPLAPGEQLGIGNDVLDVRIAPAAGGRVAQIACEGVEWLRGHSPASAAAIAWGCFPMLPWAGRLRHGSFRLDGQPYRVPVNLGTHAIHGLGFTLPWNVSKRSSTLVELSLPLPQDASWPFGGTARQRISVDRWSLRLELSLRAGRQAMPRPVLGWHPWFLKPDSLEFTPTHHYLRDAEGIATARRAGTPPAPWDDCFLNTRPVLLHRAEQTLRMSSSCDHWVVFDEPADASCVEPQSGPPDAFNLHPAAQLLPGESLSAWFQLEWL